MNDAKCTGIQNVSSTNQAERLCNEHSTDSQPYGPKIQYGELTPSEEIFLDQLLTALDQINSKLCKMLSRHK